MPYCGATVVVLDLAPRLDVRQVRNSEAVVAVALREEGWVRYSNLEPVTAHTHPIVVISISGLDQNHCAF